MPRAAREKPVPDPVPGTPDPHLHAGKCTICRHPQRFEIERAFIDWTSPREIAKTFGLRSPTTVYRHAHARGLFDLRRRNLHFGLARIAEHVAEVKPSAANVIAAFVAMAKINARGEWNAGTRFDYYEASERTRWETNTNIKREEDMDRVHGGEPTSDQIAREEMQEIAAMLKVQREAEAAARAAAEAEESEGELEQEREEEQEEGPEPEEPDEPPESPNPASASPPSPVCLEAPTHQEEEVEPEPRPQPTPQPPPNAPPLEASGPPQVAGLPWPWPREKIAFSRRRWRRPLR